MKKTILSLLISISIFSYSQTPQSRATLTTSPYGWGQRTVPVLGPLKDTWASFHNIIDDGAAATSTNSMAFTNKTGNISMWTNNSNYITLAGSRLTATSVKTSNYTAAAGDFIPCDISAGSFTVTLPSAPVDKTQIGIKAVISSGSNSVFIKTAGSDVFNKAAGSTSITTVLTNQGYILQYNSATSIWYILADDLPLSGLDARYTGTVSGGYVPYSGATNSLNLGANTFSNSAISFSTNGIITTNSTAATSTVSGTSWYNKGNSGFNLYSDDATNTENAFSVSNSSNTIAYYFNHNINNNNLAAGCQIGTNTNSDLGFGTNISAPWLTIQNNGKIKLGAGSYNSAALAALDIRGDVKISATFTTTGASVLTGGITTPTIFGSSVASGSLGIYSTSNATKGLLQLGSTGTINIGAAAVNSQTLGNIRIGPSSTEFLDFRGDGAGTFYTWVHRQGSKSGTNYSFSWDEYDMIQNDSSSHQFRFNNAAALNLTNLALNTTASDFFRLTPMNSQRSTLAETRRFYVSARTLGFGGAGGTLAIQRDCWLEPTTYTAAAATVMTDVFNFRSDAPIASTNVTITNNWAGGFVGNVKILSVTSNKFLELEGTAGQKARMSVDGAGAFFGSATNVACRFLVNNGVKTPVTLQTTGAVNIESTMFVGSASTAPQATLEVGGTFSVSGNSNFTGSVNIGNATTNTTSLGNVRIGQGTSFMDFGQNSSGIFSLWTNQTINSTSNHNLLTTASVSRLNGNTSCSLGNNGTVYLNIVGSTNAYINLPTMIGSTSAPTQTFQVTGTMGVSAAANFSAAINSAVAQTTVAGSTSGTLTASQPLQGTSWKKVIIYCNTLLGTASYTFPTAFTNTPAIVTTNGPASSVVTSLSTSAVTITGATTTGFIILEGY